MTARSIAELIGADDFLAGLKAPEVVGTCKCGKPVYASDQNGECFDCWRDRDAKRRQREVCAEYFASRVPALYRDARFDLADLGKRCADTKAIARAKSAIAKPGRVTILGPSGAGKTTLAVALGFEWARQGRHIRFCEARKLGIARSQSPLGDGEANAVIEAMSVRHVILDDVGAERDLASNAIPDIVDARFSEALPTIITTGLTPAQLGERYGDAICRRILETPALVIDVRPRGAT